MRLNFSYSMQNKELRDGNVYLSVFSDDHYAQCLLEVVHQLKDKTICFVTLNKSAASLQHTFLQHNLSLRNVFFIDTVSRSLGQSKDQDNVLYVSSPGSFTELSLAISEVMRTGAFDAVVFDSLSTLTIYDQHGKAAQQFVSSIIQKTKTGGQLGIFTCLQADLNSQLVQKSCMFVDEVVHFQHNRPRVLLLGRLMLYSLKTCFWLDLYLLVQFPWARLHMFCTKKGSLILFF